MARRRPPLATTAGVRFLPILGVADALPVMIGFCDAKLRYRFVNRGAGRLVRAAAQGNPRQDDARHAGRGELSRPPADARRRAGRRAAMVRQRIRASDARAAAPAEYIPGRRNGMWSRTEQGSPGARSRKARRASTASPMMPMWSRRTAIVTEQRGRRAHRRWVKESDDRADDRRRIADSAPAMMWVDARGSTGRRAGLRQRRLCRASATSGPLARARRAICSTGGNHRSPRIHPTTTRRAGATPLREGRGKRRRRRLKPFTLPRREIHSP
jgi:hypothetical protein